MSAQKHPYHLVDPSPLPIIGALSAFMFFFGFVLYIHPEIFFDFGAVFSGVSLFSWETSENFFTSLSLALFAPGIIMLGILMFNWWKQVVMEGYDNHHTPPVQLSYRYGMILFIISEIFFFVSFFWAFFDASLFPKEFPYDVVNGLWPPAGISTFDPFDLPLVNTLILLLSSCSVTWAHHSIMQNDRKNFIRGLAITVALGISFTLLQAIEYMHAPFAFDDGIYASTFFMATGFHGLHVIIGTIFLAVCTLRAIKGHFKPNSHFAVEAAAWYWHFVDVVWIFLFSCVYVWGG